MTVLAWGLAGLGLASLGVLGLTAGLGALAVWPRALERWVRWPVTEPADHGCPHEDFSVTTADGVTLRGWWVEATASPRRGTLVGLVGTASPRTDWSSFSALVCPRGFDLVLFDARGHGESDAAAVTYGELETEDVVSVLDELARRGRPTDDVVLVGTSLGAAVALRVAARDERVRAVVAQSPFTSPREIAQAILQGFLGPLAAWTTWAVERWATFFLGEGRQLAGSVLPVARRVHVPLLVVQGTDDPVVPLEQARAVFEAAASADKAFVVVEGGGHTSLWYGEREEYRRTLLAFLERVTAEPTRAEASEGT